MHLDWLGRPFYVTRDHLGSVREVTDAQTSGGFFRRYDYDLFGRRSTLSDNLGESPSTGPNVGYAGLYTIRVHNLPYALNRVYDPDLGRWLSRDPAGEAGGVNLYRFANNDPVNYVDLDGLCPVPSQGARVTRSPVGSGGGVRPPRPPRVTSSADASEEGGSWGPQRANAATGALRHAAWAGDINAINATAVRLGQRALERSGGDWVTSEQLFERYLQGVQNRLARTGSQFAVEIQPAAIPGRGRVPGFQQVGGTTFPTRGSRRLDAGIVGPKGKLVSGFDITLDPNKPSVVQYYQEAFGNIPIFDIRLP